VVDRTGGRATNTLRAGLVDAGWMDTVLVIYAVVDESLSELALVVFSFDHLGNSSSLSVEEFLRLDFVSLGPPCPEFRRSYTNPPTSIRDSSAFEALFLRRKVASPQQALDQP
jgi:hypothetical protein